jgi:hypothetical protein
MSRNPITGDEQKTRPATPEYLAGHEKVFGKTKVQRGRWIQDPETGKLVSASEYVRKETERARFFLMDRWDPYESETTGNVISNRRQRDYDLKSSGCRPYEGKNIELQRANAEKKEMADRAKAERLETMEKTFYEIEHGYRKVRE